MLIDTSITIAYKCTSCGSFEFFNISLFILSGKRSGVLPCRCKKSRILLEREGEGNFLIRIPCIGCGNEHTYLLTKRNILFGEQLVFNCPETGMQICFTGRDEAVRRRVDNLEEEFDELMDRYGYESYFANTRVMFDMVNRIHDIALKGNLYCECGSRDIEMAMLPECILLRCGKCGGNKKVPASKNRDLKDMLATNQILLKDDAFKYNMGIGKDFLTRQSGDKFGK